MTPEKALIVGFVVLLYIILFAGIVIRLTFYTSDYDHQNDFDYQNWLEDDDYPDNV